ncbi:MAG TPA: rhombosortase [Gammaproteobacteria bacterium]
MIHKMEGGFVKESGYYHWVFRTWPLWLLGFFAVVFSLLGGPSSPALRYERVAVLAGEWWRLLSGNLVHLGIAHLLLNLAGLALIGWIFGPGLRAAHWLWVLLGSGIAIGVGFLLLNPELAWYVGLSGVLHGLLLGAAVLDRGYDRRLRIVLILGVFAKLAWEQWAGALPFTAEAAGGPVVVDAHLYGAIGGLLAGILLALRERRAGPV